MNVAEAIIGEAQSRRDFLKRLGAGVAGMAAGIRPSAPNDDFFRNVVHPLLSGNTTSKGIEASRVVWDDYVGDYASLYALFDDETARATGSTLENAKRFFANTWLALREACIENIDDEDMPTELKNALKQWKTHVFDIPAPAAEFLAKHADARQIERLRAKGFRLPGRSPKEASRKSKKEPPEQSSEQRTAATPAYGRSPRGMPHLAHQRFETYTSPDPGSYSMQLCEGKLCDTCPFKRSPGSTEDVTVAEALVRVKLDEAELCDDCPFKHNQFVAGGHRKRAKDGVMKF